MYITFIVLVIIIMVLLICGYALLGKIEKERDEAKEYFKKLRREYDIRIEEYKEDIAARDQIISSYRSMLVNR